MYEESFAGALFAQKFVIARIGIGREIFATQHNGCELWQGEDRDSQLDISPRGRNDLLIASNIRYTQDSRFEMWALSFGAEGGSIVPFMSMISRCDYFVSAECSRS